MCNAVVSVEKKNPDLPTDFFSRHVTVNTIFFFWPYVDTGTLYIKIEGGDMIPDN